MSHLTPPVPPTSYRGRGRPRKDGLPPQKTKLRRTPAGRPSQALLDAFQMVYEKRMGDLDRWISETGDGWKAQAVLKDGTVVDYIERDPGKAADILTKMAEHFIPKLARIEKQIWDCSNEELLAEVRRRKELQDRARAVPDFDLIIQGTLVAATPEATPEATLEAIQAEEEGVPCTK